MIDPAEETDSYQVNDEVVVQTLKHIKRWNAVEVDKFRIEAQRMLGGTTMECTVSSSSIPEDDGDRAYAS